MNKKLIYSIILDLIFTILIISSLVVSRNLTRNYLNELGDYTDQIQQVKESLGTATLEDSQMEDASKTIEKVNSIANKALILNYIILPLVILILFLLFQISYWKINTKAKMKFIVLYSVLIIGLLFTLILSLLNYLEFYFFLVGNAYSLIFVIISLILIVLITYFSLIEFTRRNNLKQDLIFGLKNLKKLILQYSFLILTMFIYFILVCVLFVLSFINYSLLIPGIALFIIVLVINVQKYFLIKKISSLK